MVEIVVKKVATKNVEKTKVVPKNCENVSVPLVKSQHCPSRANVVTLPPPSLMISGTFESKANF